MLQNLDEELKKPMRASWQGKGVKGMHVDEDILWSKCPRNKKELCRFAANASALWMGCTDQMTIKTAVQLSEETPT